MKQAIKRFLRRSGRLGPVLSAVYHWPKSYWLPRSLDSAFLLNAYAQFKGTNVVFVEIGAYDGVSGDPIYEFVTKHNWKGILVEPTKNAFDRLLANYHDQDGMLFENLAIAERCGYRKLYRFENHDMLPEWFGQIASFDRKVLTKQKIDDVEHYIIEQDVPCITFEELTSRHGLSKIDLLLIDAEGYDAELIRQINPRKHEIEFLIFEHVHLNRADYRRCLRSLRRDRYVLYRCATNTIGIGEVVHERLIKAVKKQTGPNAQ